MGVPADKRTIRLTNQPPVTVADVNWPVLASARDKDHDGQVECQANRRRCWGVTVRQHADGRTLVYATYSYSSQWGHERDLDAYAGELLDHPSSEMICGRIQAVCHAIAQATHQGDDAVRWSELAAACIADMPAEELA